MTLTSEVILKVICAKMFLGIACVAANASSDALFHPLRKIIFCFKTIHMG